jgi:hypothetical protein
VGVATEPGWQLLRLTAPAWHLAGREEAAPPRDAARPRPRRSPRPLARRGNPRQSRAYVHRPGCAPSPSGPRVLRFAACCRRSAGVTPIRCRPTGKATGSRWTAGCPSSARRPDAWGSACGRGRRNGGAGVGRLLCSWLLPRSPQEQPRIPLSRSTQPQRASPVLPTLAI